MPWRRITSRKTHEDQTRVRATASLFSVFWDNLKFLNDNWAKVQLLGSPSKAPVGSSLALEILAYRAPTWGRLVHLAVTVGTASIVESKYYESTKTEEKTLLVQQLLTHLKVVPSPVAKFVWETQSIQFK
jgi:hypothetical protein